MRDRHRQATAAASAAAARGRGEGGSGLERRERGCDLPTFGSDGGAVFGESGVRRRRRLFFFPQGRSRRWGGISALQGL